MKMEDAAYRMYGPMKPLPDGEERMWQAIDQALQGKAKDVQIRVQPRRRDLPALLLAAAAVIVLLLVSFAVARRLYTEPESGELLAAEATEEPTPEPTPELIRELRAVELVNAQVDNSEIFTLSEEKRYLARAVLPEGMCVDHWEVNGEPVDAGDRRFSLEFESKGVRKVEAVLREERRVTCVNAYLQFLDENGEPAGWLYEDVCFEYDYTVPTTGEEHSGGSITAYVTPLDPVSEELDYWLIDGEKIESSLPACGIRLDELDRSVRIEAVMKHTHVRQETSETLVLSGGGEAPDFVQRLEDDCPAGQTGSPENTMTEVDYERDGVPFDPDAPARDGHIHQWEIDKTRSWESTCTDTGQRTMVCSVCGRAYSYPLPTVEHQYFWQSNSGGCRCVCAVCYSPRTPDDVMYSPHSWVQEGDRLVCSHCGYVGTGYTG